MAQILSSHSNKIQEGRYDVVTMVPAYNEGMGILGTLYSTATQESLDETSYGVCVVLNAPDNASEQVRESNEATKRLIYGIWDKKAPEDLWRREELEQDANERIAMFEEITQRGMNLILVDMSSGRYAPAQCNVGIACRDGCDEILPLIKDDGLLLRTDADSYYDTHAVANAETHMRKDTKSAAAIGRLHFYVPKKDVELVRAQFISEMEWTVIRGQKAVHYKYRFKPDNPHHRSWHMSGGNMIVRKSSLLETPFEPVAGAEDTGMSLDIQRKGHRLGRCDNCLVHTPLRVSLRTEKGHGLGQGVEDRRLFSEQPQLYLVPPLQQTFYIDMLFDFLENLRQNYGEQREEFLDRIQTFAPYVPPDGKCVPRISGEEALQLFEAVSRAPNIAVQRNNVVHTTIDEIAEKKFPHIPLQQACEELSEQLEDQDEELYGAMSRFISHIDSVDRFSSEAMIPMYIELGSRQRAGEIDEQLASNAKTNALFYQLNQETENLAMQSQLVKDKAMLDWALGEDAEQKPRILNALAVIYASERVTLYLLAILKLFFYEEALPAMKESVAKTFSELDAELEENRQYLVSQLPEMDKYTQNMSPERSFMDKTSQRIMQASSMFKKETETWRDTES